ncbi:MAG: hypothetical protein LBU65_02875 [Planctomycetaceae bacterium]|nr:hypothetical protein [Planctomycetaceae bacterium]
MLVKCVTQKKWSSLFIIGGNTTSRPAELRRANQLRNLAEYRYVTAY